MFLQGLMQLRFCMYSPAQINAAGPPGAAGAVNGAGQAVSALMRAIGPTIGGFSWSASISLHMPGQQYLVRTTVLPFTAQVPLGFCNASVPC